MGERKIGVVNDNMDKRYTYAEHNSICYHENLYIIKSYKKGIL